MKISGFTMAKNASKLYYPWREAIMSILPIVDEFIVALGECDKDDNSRELIESINSDKIKIIDTKWDIKKYPNGMENAHQTDIAKEHCSGDWLFYLQADEVIHEKYLPVIKSRCEELLNDDEVEGLLFKYRHFWGDYDHYHNSHAWYKEEIRIIRNRPDIHSWQSAQSFRRIPDFDGLSYRQEENTFKLKVKWVDAYVYHYGWVRPPHLMRQKSKALDTIHKGAEEVQRLEDAGYYDFDYGALNKLPVHNDSHPEVMKDVIAKFDWADKLNYTNKGGNTVKFKHDKLKYKLVSGIENNLLGGRPLGSFKNYILLK